MAQVRRYGPRGQPLVLLAVILLGWGGVRVMTWEMPQAWMEQAAPRVAARTATGHSVTAAAAPAGPATVSGWPVGALAILPEPLPATPLATGLVAGADQPVTAERLPWFAPLPAPLPIPLPAPLPAAAPMPMRVAVGHNLLLAAGLSQMELPPAFLAVLQREGVMLADAAPQPVPPAPRRPVAPATSRWTADGWLMVRPGGAGPLLAGRPSYGRSQAGAVVRYRLAPHSPNAPQAHLRAATALSGAHEGQAALGLSARPVPAVPVRLAAEVRADGGAGGTRLRPAVWAVTELPPARLPLDLRAEVYAQGGYVAGQGGTAFVDGQVRVDRPVASLHGVDLRAGAGVWGGAQAGASRLDIGPAATASFRLGPAQGRLAADYRLRVAGTAEPASGPAITLSAGF